jgi:hypothetical protein
MWHVQRIIAYEFMVGILERKRQLLEFQGTEEYNKNNIKL